MVRPFQYQLPRLRVHFGQNVVEDLPNVIPADWRKALLVSYCDDTPLRTHQQRIETILQKRDVEVVAFNQVSENPTTDTVDHGAEVAHQQGCDFVVGFGGGSVMDAAKAIALAASHHGEISTIWDFVVRDGAAPRTPTKDALPVVVITTTSGTGSHVNDAGVLTNPATRQKPGVGHPSLVPKETFVDLDILAGMPPRVTAATGFDVLAHTMEGFLSRLNTPVSEPIQLQAIKLVHENVVRAVEDGDDLEARANLALGDLYAGMSLLTTPPNVPHALGHALGGHYEIVHGLAVATTYAAVHQYNIERGNEQVWKKYMRIGQAVGVPSSGAPSIEAALEAVQPILRLIEQLELNPRLDDLGVHPERFETMADDALQVLEILVTSNPTEVNKNDLVQLFQACQ